MKKLLLIACTALLLCGADPLLAGQPGASSPSPTVLVIGDSISIRYTRYLKGELKHLSVKHVPAYAESTAYSLEHIHAWLHQDDAYSIIVANWGLWDMAYRKGNVTHPHALSDNDCSIKTGKIAVPLPQYRANLEKLAAAIQPHAQAVIWVTTTPVPEGEGCRIPSDVPKYNAALKEVAAAHGFSVLDLYAQSPAYLKFQKPSNVHYTNDGYRVITGIVMDALKAKCESILAGQGKTLAQQSLLCS